MKRVPEIRHRDVWAKWGWAVASAARDCGVTVEGILSKKRTPTVVRARTEAIVSLYGSGLPYAEIGRLLGMNHSSAMDAVRRWRS